MHVLHDPGAVNFNRLLRGSQFGRNLLVQTTGNDVAEHLPFARGEGLEAPFGFGKLERPMVGTADGWVRPKTTLVSAGAEAKVTSNIAGGGFEPPTSGL